MFENATFYEFDASLFTEYSLLMNQVENINFYAFIQDLQAAGYNIQTTIELMGSRYGYFPLPLFATDSPECELLLQSQADSLFSKRVLSQTAETANIILDWLVPVRVDVAKQAAYWCAAH